MPGKPCPLRKRSRCKDGGGKRSLCDHGRERSRCKDCGGSGLCEHGREHRYCKECGGSSMCEHGRQRRFARIAVAACGLMNPRAWRISSATLAACVKYRSVCVSPGGANSHGRRPARGRPGVGPHFPEEKSTGKMAILSAPAAFFEAKRLHFWAPGWTKLSQKKPL